MLTKTTRIYNKIAENGHLVMFGTADEDTGMVTSEIVVIHEIYADLGSPDQVTITIEPGDQLNTEV
jgi:hypothetical protein